MKRKFQIEPSQPFYGSIFRQIEMKVDTKCQLISKQNCSVLNFPKMQQNIAMISALATKTWTNQKNKGTLLH